MWQGPEMDMISLQQGVKAFASRINLANGHGHPTSRSLKKTSTLFSIPSCRLPGFVSAAFLNAANMQLDSRLLCDWNHHLQCTRRILRWQIQSPADSCFE